jgi:purine-binding chemotaxis protein CheW
VTMTDMIERTDTGQLNHLYSVSEEDQDQFLTFGLTNELFAINVQQVREVLDLQRLTPLANAPGALLGITDVRGCSVPVMDLKQKLGLGWAEPDDHARIVVLQVRASEDDVVVGVLADAVYEVAQIAREKVEPPPRIGLSWDQAFIIGIGRREGRFVTLLDLNQVFAQSKFT